ncbi:polyunsaturated fatty acid 5-lipoxygenase-like [Oculina patagonica]
MISLQLIVLVVQSLLCLVNGYAGICGDECPIELSQKTSLACQRKRYQMLLGRRQLFQLAPFPGLEGEPIRLLNMTVDQQLAIFSSPVYPFEAWELNIFLTKIQGGTAIHNEWIKLNAGEDIQSFADFVKIYAFFRKAQGEFGDPYFKNPSDEEPFKDVITHWMRDKVFAEQRLAGVNPMTLTRVTTDRDKVGIKWTELNKTLNQEFDWNNLIINTPNMPNIPLERAIATRMVFVLRYPLLDYLPAMPDLLESRPGREMWEPTSPIAFFAVHPNNRSDLVPIAIQMDVRPGSPVYTPKDKDLWMLAKLSVQGADFGYNQIAEHLAKTHLLMEPFCVSKDRQLSERHPLHQIIKYHCRGISITDKLAFAILLAENGSIHKLFPYGYQGGASIGLRSFRQTSWKDTDFLGNIRKRGVERRSLHYFPYRDDGYLLYYSIYRVAREYVNLYYECDEDVMNDFELQNFMNEVSADGTGSDGGLGNIRDLPAELSSRNSLVTFLTRFLYQISVHHAAINYPLTDYGAFTPNMPTKLYNDSRVAEDVFSLFNFPNANISAEQGLVSMSLSNYRFDTLFDYGSQLPDKPARQVISKWFNYLQRSVQPCIEKRNRDRLAKGHLSYPYLLPRWIPNGIQT